MAQIQTVLGTATDLEVSVVGFAMGATAAQFRWILKDSTGKLVSNGLLLMTGSTFANWGADDNYVVQWAATELNLTLI